MRIFKFLLLTISLSLPFTGYSQPENKTFRKCFVIAYKSEFDFSKTEQQSNVENTLKSLFNNKIPNKTDDENDRKLIANDFSDFFNPQTDEILFFDYGLYKQNWDYNDRNLKTDDSIQFFNYFIEHFIQLQNQFSTGNSSIDDFFNVSLNKCREKSKSGTAAAPSACVLPLVFTRIPQNICAEEYYLLQISNFNDPSTDGLNGEKRLLNDVLHKKSDLLQNDFINPILKKINNSGKFTFTYLPKTLAYRNDSIIVKARNRKYASIVGYKVVQESVEKPAIESNIKFEQLKYGEDIYKHDAVKIRFPHNEYLHINSIYEDVSTEQGNVLHREVEASQDNDFYTVAPSDVEFPSFVRDKDFTALDVKYTFNVQLQLLDAPDCKLGFVYTTPPRSLLVSDIDFQDATSTIFWYWFWKILPWVVLAALALFAIAVYRGKNIKISSKDIEIEGFTDTFKEMKNCVITETPYCAWDDKTKTVSLGVKINPQYKKWFKIKWKYKLAIKANINDLENSGLTANIHNTDGSGKKKISETFVLIDDEYNISLTQPVGKNLDFEHKRYTFDIVTNISITKSFLWWNIKENINNIRPYRFEIGKNLGKIWVGFDPGTTGSSIAFGNDSRKIHFNKYKDGKNLSTVNNSVIAFEKSNLKKDEYSEWAAGTDYLYGLNAHSAPEKYQKFRSMKKLLGYANELPITVEGERLFDLKGTQIFSLLVRGLYKDLQDYVKHKEGNGYLLSNEKRELCPDGNFAPQRAVVAVPNSFSSRRTQDMITSVADLKKFKEIIPVYEAESVLFYCIKRNIIENSSKVLIFDMGGATINTSFFDLYIEKGKDGTQYAINTLGRIGYGIGGDTIDFCIINAVLSIKALQETLDIEDNAESIKMYRNNNASKLLSLAFKIKEDIVLNFSKTDEAYLITANNLTTWAKQFLDNDNIDINDDDIDFKRIFARDGELFNKCIQNTVYDNIQDAIKELLAFKEVSDCKRQQIKLVFSGRSTAFPSVEKNVIDALNGNGFNIDIKRLSQSEKSLDTLKTVVAEGACWYGLQRSNVTLINNKCFYSFAVKKSIDSTDAGTAFETFIKRGQAFTKNMDGKMEIREEKLVNSTFGNDSNKADIYQVTGDSPQNYYNREGVKHKISLIASLDAVTKIEKIELALTPDDMLECVAKYDKNPSNNRRSNGSMQSIDIANENNEHYIFATKQEQIEK